MSSGIGEVSMGCLVSNGRGSSAEYGEDEVEVRRDSWKLEEAGQSR